MLLKCVEGQKHKDELGEEEEEEEEVGPPQGRKRRAEDDGRGGEKGKQPRRRRSSPALIIRKEIAEALERKGLSKGTAGSYGGIILNVVRDVVGESKMPARLDDLWAVWAEHQDDIQRRLQGTKASMAGYLKDIMEGIAASGRSAMPSSSAAPATSQSVSGACTSTLLCFLVRFCVFVGAVKNPCLPWEMKLLSPCLVSWGSCFCVACKALGSGSATAAASSSQAARARGTDGGGGGGEAAAAAAAAAGPSQGVKRKERDEGGEGEEKKDNPLKKLLRHFRK
jgi:hypothetical protein